MQRLFLLLTYFQINGTEIITLNLPKPTNSIILDAAELVIKKCYIIQGNETISAKPHIDEKNERLTIKLAKKNEVFSSLNVWLGKKEKIEIYTKEDIYITVPKRKKKLIKGYIEYSGPIEAPIAKDSKLGELLIYYDDTLFKRYDVFSTEQIKKLNIFLRLIKSFNYMLWGDV